MRDEGVREGKLWRVQAAVVRNGFCGRGGVVDVDVAADGGIVTNLVDCCDCRGVARVGAEARVVASVVWEVGRGASVAMPRVKTHRWVGCCDGRKPVKSCFAGTRIFWDVMMWM